MKSRTRRKLFWSAVAFVLAVALAVIIVPPFINLDHMAPKIESAVYKQTGIEIKINGPVRLSLLGRATISARDVTSPSYGGRIDSVSFYIPYRNILNIDSTAFRSTIILNRADLSITSLTPPSGVGGSVVFRDSSLTFMGKKYEHINGIFKNGMFNGSVRTSDHKYTIQSNGDTFTVTNPNIDLNLTGQLFTDGRQNLTAVGSISLETDNINKWFEFDTPKIKGRIKFRSNFQWSDGRFKFYDISGEGLSGDFFGSIEFGNGKKKIDIVANGVEFDFSTLINTPEFFKNSEINFSGNGKFTMKLPKDSDFRLFGDTEVVTNAMREGKYNKMSLSVSADNDAIKLKSFKAESRDQLISMDGEITRTQTTGLNLTVTDMARHTAMRCLLSGAKNVWSCARFDYKSPAFSATGKLEVESDSFVLEMASKNLSLDGLLKQVPVFQSLFARQKADMMWRLGNDLTVMLSAQGKFLEFRYFDHKNTTLAAIPGVSEFIKYLPDRMRESNGIVYNAHIKNNKLLSLSFEHQGKNKPWALSLDENGGFMWAGDFTTVLHAYYPDIDLQFLNPWLPAEIKGKFKRPYISDLEIIIPGNVFVGKFDGKAFDFHTDILDLDELANQDYIDNYEARQYVSTEPLTIPFALNMSGSLSANKVKFSGEVYENFNYSLKPGIQKMSVTDAARGSLLLSIEKKISKYILVAQFNKFEILGLVLPQKSPLNVADTMLTAHAELETFGITAHDFWANIAGDIDLTFDGGFLIGFDFDKFYAGAKNITKFNAEYAISDALNGGDTRLKSLHLTGFYDGGNFITTSKLTASARHTEITGALQIVDGKISADLSVLLRGTAPVTRPISLRILSNGERDYSLTDIMQSLDPDFMREFIRIHDRF